MPSSLDLDEARARWQQIAAEDPGLAAIARFNLRRLESLAERPAPQVALRISPEAAETAVRSGQPILLAGELEVDLDEIGSELADVAAVLRDAAQGEAATVARSVASAPAGYAELLAAALRSDEAAIEAGAYRLGLPHEPIRGLLELAVQPALWAAAEESLLVAPLDRWQRGFCPVCGAWPLYAELVGAQMERHLRCGRCGSGWSWAVLLCPYCGNDDHRTLGSLQNEAEREHRRVDTCERCRGYLKAMASFTRASAPQLAAEDAATVHLDLNARAKGYERPGRPPDPAEAGVPRLVREPPAPHDVPEG